MQEMPMQINDDTSYMFNSFNCLKSIPIENADYAKKIH